MSEAPPETCDVDALLTEVAALDMALLRHVNAQALAATEPEVLNGLVRSQQRLARSVRTTLSTRARLARQREGEGAAQARPSAPADPFGPLPWEEREAQNRAEAAARAATREAGQDPESRLKAAVVERLRLEYDPAEVEAIDHELYDMIDEVWEDGGFARELPAERLRLMLGHIRQTFGPSRTRTPAEAPQPPAPPQADTGSQAPSPAPTPEAPEPPAPEPEPEAPEPEAPEPPAPEPPSGPAAPEPYVPPWERRPPHAFDRGGGGSGW